MVCMQELKYWQNNSDVKLHVFSVLHVLLLPDSSMTLTFIVCTSKVKWLFGADQDIAVVMLWEETGVSEENPYVQPADHKSSHMPMLRIRCWTHG